jgi:hypothetical protein
MTASLRERSALAAATLALLLPFVGKALHVDDPLFVWTAEQIHESPLDFYGRDVLWLGVRESMATANLNPPGASYYLAAVAAIGGFGERALHLGMLLPALALVLGTHRVAGALGAPGLRAALLLLAFPAFLVSATSLMVDVLAAALFTWAIALWLEALEKNGAARFAAAGLAAGACLLTKHLGIGLVPLLLVHGALVRKRPGAWLLAPLLAAAIALLFRAAMIRAYGVDPLGLAGAYSLGHEPRTLGSLFRGLVVGLSFLGGSCVAVALLAPWLWQRRELALGAVAGGALALAAGVSIVTYATEPVALAVLLLHFAAFVASGLGICALLARRVVAEPGASSWLLAGWIGGVFVFAAFFNWTTNVRSLLPAVPAVAVLAADALARRGFSFDTALRRAALAAGIALSLAVAHADAGVAQAARRAAEELADRFGDEPSVRFHGTWGFQYYLEAAGVRKLDPAERDLPAGTVLLLAEVSGSPLSLPPGSDEILEERAYPTTGLAATHHPTRGAGWYGSFIGPVPFVLGAPPDTGFRVVRLLRGGSVVPEHR